MFYVRSIINNLKSFNVSKRLNKIISRPGKMFINGDFIVSTSIINAINDICTKLLIFDRIITNAAIK